MEHGHTERDFSVFTPTAVYLHYDFTTESRMDMLNRILSEHPETLLNGNSVYLTGKIQSVDLVTDRSITLSFALILPDEQFYNHIEGEN